MDFILDVVFGLLLAIFQEIKPDRKLKRRQENVLIALSVLLLLCTIGCFVAGLCLLSSARFSRTAGVILLTVGITLILSHCVAYAVLIGKRLKSEAQSSDGDGGSKES